MTERLIVTMPVDLAASIRAAVVTGGYASPSEIVQEALRDWNQKQAGSQPSLASLQAKINKGLQGKGRDASEVLADLDALIDAKVAARA